MKYLIELNVFQIIITLNVDYRVWNKIICIENHKNQFVRSLDNNEVEITS